jgi:hypothetical protein
MLAVAKVDRSDKVDVLKRLSRFAKNTEPAAGRGSARPRGNKKGRRESPPAHCQPPAASYLTKSISR